MPVIEDIRVYESKNADNPSSFSQTGDVFCLYHFSNTKVNSALLRLVMKLREYKFTLESSHLYMVLTPGINDGETVLPEPRKGEFSWMRIVFLGVNRKIFNRKCNDEKVRFIVDNAIDIICNHFSDDQQCHDIRSISKAVIEKGSELEITYREKMGTKYEAQVRVRVITPTQLKSYVQVLDGSQIVYRGTLPDMSLPTFVQQVGQLNITQSSVSVKPRTGSYAKNMGLNPIKFEFCYPKLCF